ALSSVDIMPPLIVLENNDDIQTSIIVIAYNQLQYTKLCVESILHYTADSYELILLDNGSTDGTSDYFEFIRNFHPHTRIIRNFQNRIAESILNYAVSIACGKYIVFVTNDTLVHEGWLENFIRQIESAPDIGIVGPRSNNISGPQLASADYDTIETFQSFAAEWCKQHWGENFLIERMVGMLTIMKKASLERVGGLDPDLPTNGRDGGYGFSDDDISLRFLLAGYKLLVANDVFIHHVGSMTTRQYRPDLFGAPQNINKEKYMKKLQRNERISIGPHGAVTLKPYGLDELIPVAENTVIMPTRICIVESDPDVVETTGHPASYAALAASYRGEVISSDSNSLQPLLTRTITKGGYDFIALV
ncbi:MAG: glycosyltransferase, partial [Syntrophales bacterium LBB04]|nr:glycosyltransferase [Syntrophales bacterium LBB04]